jgi:hypothetical protein
VSGDPFGALPEVPLPPDVSATQPQPEVRAVQPEIPQPLPAVSQQPDPPRPTNPLKPVDPKPVDPVKPVEPKMVPPRVPAHLPPMGKGEQPAPLPPPREADPGPQPLPQPQPGSQPELSPAPAELMYPAGALGANKHAVFGSPPIRLSRDYPPLHDLIRRGHNHDGITLSDDGDGDGTGGPLNRFFLSGEYLLWWVPGYPTPVLATTNANTNLNGYFGEPGTTSLFGPGGFVGSTRSGFRVRGGAWLDDCSSCGIDGSFFFLGRRSDSAVIGPNGFPLITRPVFIPNTLPGTGAPLGENGEFVALPGVLRGSLSVQGDSQLWGADVNVRRSLCNTCNTRAEVFAGYRHLNLRESLTITENIAVIGPGGDRLALTDPVGTQVTVRDHFQTRNQFHGGQIGGLYQRRWGRWDATGRASVALGSTHQVLEIDGVQVRQQPGMPPMTFRGGLLAAGPNLGTFTRDRFSVAPELTLSVGYRVTDHLRVFAGYNFLLWTNVIRPGDQIDRVVDVSFVPNSPPAPPSGMSRPHPLFAQRDLVVNGIQFGLDWRW